MPGLCTLPVSMFTASSLPLALSTKSHLLSGDQAIVWLEVFWLIGTGIGFTAPVTMLISSSATCPLPWSATMAAARPSGAPAPGKAGQGQVSRCSAGPGSFRWLPVTGLRTTFRQFPESQVMPSHRVGPTAESRAEGGGRQGGPAAEGVPEAV